MRPEAALPGRSLRTLAVTAAVIAVAAPAWALLVTMMGAPMGAASAGGAHAMSGHPVAMGEGGGSTMSASMTDGSAGMTPLLSMGPASFVLMWLLMVGAMMLPTVGPMLTATWVYLSRQPTAARAGRYAAFVSAYVTAWALAGGVALALWMLVGAVSALAIPLVAVAGAYQLSGLKDRCLRVCRTPVGFLMQHGVGLRSLPGAFAVGTRHAGFCVGCCAGLMVALTGAGVVDVAWMAALALLMLLEKVHPHGRAMGRAAGVLLLAASPFAARLAGGDGLARTVGAASIISLAVVALATLRPHRLRVWRSA